MQKGGKEKYYAAEKRSFPWYCAAETKHSSDFVCL